jgi:hypothetical protein
MTRDHGAETGRRGIETERGYIVDHIKEGFSLRQ